MELPQLPRWISADKKGALDRAGIQLADGRRSPACRCSAPLEPDLIRMQAPSQPTPAARDGGRQLSCPGPAPVGTRVPQILPRPLVPVCAVEVTRRGLSSIHQPATLPPAAFRSMTDLQPQRKLHSTPRTQGAHFQNPIYSS